MENLLTSMKTLYNSFGLLIIWHAQVKVGLLNLCKGLFSLNVHEE